MKGNWRIYRQREDGTKYFEYTTNRDDIKPGEMFDDVPEQVSDTVQSREGTRMEKRFYFLFTLLKISV